MPFTSVMLSTYAMAVCGTGVDPTPTPVPVEHFPAERTSATGDARVEDPERADRHVVRETDVVEANLIRTERVRYKGDVATGGRCREGRRSHECERLRCEDVNRHRHGRLIVRDACRRVCSDVVTGHGLGAPTHERYNSGVDRIQQRSAQGELVDPRVPASVRDTWAFDGVVLRAGHNPDIIPVLSLIFCRTGVIAPAAHVADAGTGEQIVAVVVGGTGVQSWKVLSVVPPCGMYASTMDGSIDADDSSNTVRRLPPPSTATAGS